MLTTRKIVLNIRVLSRRDLPKALQALIEVEDPSIKTALRPVPKGILLYRPDGPRSAESLTRAIQERGFRFTKVNVFAREDCYAVRASFSQDGDTAPAELLLALNAMCINSSWMIKAYRNAALRNGEIVPETSDISIAMAALKPVRSLGKPTIHLDASFLNF